MHLNCAVKLRWSWKCQILSLCQSTPMTAVTRISLERQQFCEYNAILIRSDTLISAHTCIRISNWNSVSLCDESASKKKSTKFVYRYKIDATSSRTRTLNLKWLKIAYELSWLPCINLVISQRKTKDYLCINCYWHSWKLDKTSSELCQHQQNWRGILLKSAFKLLAKKLTKSKTIVLTINWR